MQTWVYWIIISASFYFIFFFTQATSARSCIFYGASPVTMLMCELPMITQIINDPDRMKNEDICGQCRADPQHIHCRCLCPPHSVCAEPAVRWRHDGDWHQPSPRVLLWASWTGPQEGAPTSVIPLKKYHIFFFFTYLLKCNVLYQDIARMFTLRHQLRILTHQFMLQMVEHAIFWGAVWCIWNILIINHLSVCICSPPEPVISLVHRDYWQCFEQLTHQDACGR